MNDVTTYDYIIPLLFTMTTDPEQQYSRLTSDHTSGDKGTIQTPRVALLLLLV